MGIKEVKPLVVRYQDSLISIEEISGLAERLGEEVQRMKEASSSDYGDDRASINLPFDREMLSSVVSLVEEKSRLKPGYLVVAGIGGSSLGTIAVQEAVLGRFFNQLDPEVKTLYADTVDSDLMDSIIRLIEPALKEGGNVVLNCVSKSGRTTETVANFQVLVDLLKKYKTDYEKYVVVTTDKDSALWNLASEKGFSLLEIPKKVGGRFSVFSPAGLFPLGLLGVDLEALMEGAALMRDRCLQVDIWENPAALSAALMFLHYRRGRNICDLFLFSPDLESVGKWYRQLLAESLGKEYDRKGVKVFEGITPLISIGSTDLHSMAQLYLGGPQDKFTCFVGVKENRSDVKAPALPEYSWLVEGIQGRPLGEIMAAILEGVKASFRKGERPFIEVILPDKSPSSIGQFLQFKMLEVVYLGFLLNVNPFDQPNVEDYKVETRKILS